MRKGSSVIVGLTIAALATGCGSSSRGDSGTPRIEVAAPEARVDWSNIAIPGTVCGAKQPIHLKDGSAEIRSRLLPKGLLVHVGIDDQPFWGDLDEDGLDEAALGVICTNGGGTAGGQIAFSSIVFAVGKRGGLKAIGVLTPQQRPRSWHATILNVVSMGFEKIVTLETLYGPNDATCCASGLAATLWELRKGRLRVVRSALLRKPR
jgi:hypothetical protein